MISYHPKDELLTAFVSGDLPASLSAAIAIHADMCPSCQEKIAKLTVSQASLTFEEANLHRFIVDENESADDIAGINFDDMISAITDDDSIEQIVASKEKQVTIGDTSYTLPKALNSVELSNFMHLGKIARARCKLNEGEIHSSLLHIEPGGGVPEHTHKGYELTLLLAGEFSDEYGSYVPGDFILLDASNTHNPVSQSGCLCFTVANDSLHFTQGINRLLNPIGSFIY